MTFSEEGTLVQIYNDVNKVPDYMKQYFAQFKLDILDWDDTKNDVEYLKINTDWKPKNPNFLRDQVLI